MAAKISKMKGITGFRSFIFSPIIIYIFRCLVGFSHWFLAHENTSKCRFILGIAFHHVRDFSGRKDSPRLTLERVKANLIGASSAFIVIALPIDMFYKIMVGIVVSAVLCSVFILLNVSRTAVVAIIIILIEKPNDGFMASIDRFLSVLVGCTIGLLVVIFTGSLIKFLHKKLLKVERRINHEH